MSVRLNKEYYNVLETDVPEQDRFKLINDAKGMIDGTVNDPKDATLDDEFIVLTLTGDDIEIAGNASVKTLGVFLEVIVATMKGRGCKAPPFQ